MWMANVASKSGGWALDGLHASLHVAPLALKAALMYTTCFGGLDSLLTVLMVTKPPYECATRTISLPAARSASAAVWTAATSSSSVLPTTPSPSEASRGVTTSRPAVSSFWISRV